MKSFLLTVVLSFVTSLSWAHGDGESRVSIEPEAQGTYNAGTIQYSFQLFDGQTSKSLSDKDLVITNTKILHFIAYDPSRNEFNHVHPSFDGKVWNVTLSLLANGNYFFWAQGQLIDGTEFSTVVKAQIANGKPEIPVVPLVETRKATDKNTAFQLSNTKLKAGAMAMIDFVISRDDGKPVQLTPYLGAMAHIIAVSPDGDELLHVHPTAGSKPNTGMIHTTFPSAGDFRVWIQLVDRGELKTIPLSLVVSK